MPSSKIEFIDEEYEYGTQSALPISDKQFNSNSGPPSTGDDYLCWVR